MFKYLLKRKFSNFLIFVFILILAIIQVFTSLIHTFALDKLVIGEVGDFFKIYIFGLIAYLILIFGLFYLDVYKTKIIQKTIIDIRKDYTENIEGTSFSNFYKKDIGEHISFFNNDMNLIEQSSLESFYKLISVVFTTMFSLIALFKFDYRILITTIIFTIIIVLVPNIFSKKVRKVTENFSNSNGVMISGFRDQLQGFKDYYYSNQKNKLSANIMIIGFNFLKEKVKYKISTGLYSSVVSSLSVFAQIGIVILTGYLVTKGAVTIGAMVSVGNIASIVFNSLSQVGTLIISIKSANSIYDKIKVFDVNNKNVKIKNINNITIEKLQYSYENKLILKNIDFKIEKGCKYAIIGESGCGKSTLIQILLGNKREYQGDIYYDNVNLSEIDENSIIENVSYLDNKVHIFNETLLYNITLDKEIATDNILNMLEVVNLPEFKDRLNEVINTESLSEGQKQRIGILRVLLADKDIVIFDEAVSNLDKENAKIINELLINSDKTYITINHNLQENEKNKFTDILYL